MLRDEIGEHGADGSGRRIEDWVASNLEGADRPGRGEGVSAAGFGPLSPGRAGEGRKSLSPAGRPAPVQWDRFRLVRRGEVTVVRLSDRALIKESDLDDLEGDLNCLIDAGHHRIVLNFAEVERLSSRVVGVVVGALRRCGRADGGLLKVCGLRPDLSAVFQVAGVAGGVAVVADEAAAVGGAWPDRRFPRTLPAALLSALKDACDPADPRAGADPAASPGDGASETVVRLKVRGGRLDGRSLTVRGPRFVIGRDPSCDLRVASPAVSRAHAAVECGAGVVRVRDLGSTNGTTVDGRTLRGEAIEAADGALIRVGGFCLELKFGGRAAGRLGPDSAPLCDDMIADWLTDARENDPAGEEPSTRVDVATLSDDDGRSTGVRYAVIQDTLVVTPALPAIDDEAAVTLLRETLNDLFTRPLPRRVVVNLEYVGRLSGQAVGVLVAHYLRLDRTGGALRICQARARLLAVLEQIHLTALMDCPPTVDEAVLNAWPTRNAADAC